MLQTNCISIISYSFLCTHSRLLESIQSLQSIISNINKYQKVTSVLNSNHCHTIPPIKTVHFFDFFVTSAAAGTPVVAVSPTSPCAKRSSLLAILRSL
eukprot:c21609_g1_i1 orf=1-291(-)